MKKGWKALLTLFAIVLCFASVISVDAATFKSYHWSEDPAIKAGGAWFRSTMTHDEGSDIWRTAIEMSKKSKKTGFVPIIQGDNLDGGFVTDGKTVYYLQAGVFKSFEVKTKKSKVVKKLPKATGIYYDLHGVHDSKIWIMGRKAKYGVPALYSYNLKTKKFKTEKKNFLCFNAAALTRYLLISEGRTELKTKSGSTYKLKVYDKVTGESTLLTKKGIIWGYASGGGGYESMGKWIAYGEFNNDKNAWQVKEYKFSNKKTYVLKTLKKKEKLSSLMWMGTGVRYYLASDKEGDAWKDSRVLKAK